MAVEINDTPSTLEVKLKAGATLRIPNTVSNRKVLAVILRLLADAAGRPLYSFEELSALLGYPDRRNTHNFWREFSQTGRDFQAFCTRQRKVDATVVDGVLRELRKTPLAGATGLAPRVNGQLGRNDLSVANIQSALEQISCVPVLRTLRRQLAAGQAHYQEAYVLTELLESPAPQAPHPTCWGVPGSDGGMRIADPTALTALVTPELPLQQVAGSLCWLTFLMTLFYWNVPLSVLGRWCGVHKTTILRWVLGVALALWPLVYQCIEERVKAQMVYVDEKWLKIRGRWHYWFVVLDVTTELPVLAVLLPSRSQWACRWLGWQLRRLKKVPRVIITDGLQAYACLVPGAKHVLCRFHHQQGVTHWLKQHFATEAEINMRKPAMKQLFRTRDKRTVRRRLARLKEQAPALGIMTWITGVQEKLPQLICSVGSARLPSTTNALERFFRTFQRFYATRGGFHSVLSAKRELLLFLVVYLFTQRATDGQTPIEAILPEARRMPLYRLINDPFRALQGRESVKPAATMADLLLPEAAAA
jgi:transposase-like protein